MKLHRNSPGYFLLFIILISLAFPSLAQKSSKNSDKYLISAEDFKSKVENKDNIVILDVRTPEEYEESHIKGSVNVDYKNENFREQIVKLDEGKKYYIYCRSGKRSANSRKIMNELGIKRVYDLQGGILAWKKQDYPLMK
jgi:rhodanese-related sulfurtransferase